LGLHGNFSFTREVAIAACAIPLRQPASGGGAQNEGAKTSHRCAPKLSEVNQNWIGSVSSAGAYRLISIPQLISSILGADQTIFSSHARCRAPKSRELAVDAQTRVKLTIFHIQRL
jgi:hypothetical protein